VVATRRVAGDRSARVVAEVLAGERADRAIALLRSVLHAVAAPLHAGGEVERAVRATREPARLVVAKARAGLRVEVSRVAVLRRLARAITAPAAAAHRRIDLARARATQPGGRVEAEVGAVEPAVREVLLGLARFARLVARLIGAVA